MDVRQFLIYFFMIFSLLLMTVTLLFPKYLWFLFALPTFTGISYFLAYVCYDYFNTDTVDSENKIVLITGCDTGFGHALARRLDALGFYVYAGVLSSESSGSKDLIKECSKNLKVRQMNVTSDEDVAKVVDEIRSDIKSDPKKSLWSVVNNAGVASGCPFDWGAGITNYEKTASVNLFGAIRVTMQCTSLLRQSCGRIINVGSMAGRVAFPSMSAYTVTKYGLRGFNDTVRRELSRDNVKAILIEPTFYRTALIDQESLARNRAKLYEESTEEVKEYYKAHYEQLNKATANTIYSANSSPEEVVDSMVKAITLESPKLYYKCTFWWRMPFVLTINYVPEIIIDTVYLRLKSVSNIFSKKRQ